MNVARRAGGGRRLAVWSGLVLVLVLLLGLALGAPDGGAGALLAQGPTAAPAAPAGQASPLESLEAQGAQAVSAARDPLGGEPFDPWREALISLPLAALLGTALAFRPVRRGTPPRDPAVIQTQIVLAIVGALIMLVVGASLARAFGIVGAASLVRYRAKIDDPKDAAVMLVALSIGLASGVGIYIVAAVCTIFILIALWILESIEPKPRRELMLRIAGKEVDDLRPEVEALLKRVRVPYELRATGNEEVNYSLDWPVRRRTDRLVDAILQLDKSGEATVEVAPPKKK